MAKKPKADRSVAHRRAILRLVKAADAVAALEKRPDGLRVGVTLEVRASTDRGQAAVAFDPSRTMINPTVWSGDGGHEFAFQSWEQVVDRLLKLVTRDRSGPAPASELKNPFSWLYHTARAIRRGEVRYGPDRVAGLLEAAAAELAAHWRDGLDLAAVVARQRRALAKPRTRKAKRA